MIYLANEASLPDWNVKNVLQFADTQECPPHDAKELFAFSASRILDLKHELEDGENSIVYMRQREEKETKLRILISHWFREHTNSNYAVYQEEEQADARKHASEISVSSARYIRAARPINVLCEVRYWCCLLQTNLFFQMHRASRYGFPKIYRRSGKHMDHAWCYQCQV